MTFPFAPTVAITLTLVLASGDGRGSSPAVAPSPDDGAPSAAIDSLVAAERGFSAFSVEHGMRDAFLAFLSDSSTIFRPLPVDGKRAWQESSPVPGTLVWGPAYAEVSLAGDLGVTTGPWEYHPPAERKDAPVGHGHFISVWRREADGRWRVAVDLGAGHREPSGAMPRVGSGLRPTLHEPSPLSGARSRPTDVAKLDRTLSRESRSKGARRAFAARAAADVRFNTDGAFPMLGPAAAGAALDTLAGALEFTPRATGVSASGDLAYSCGVIGRRPRGATTPADSLVYLNVWRRGAGGDWRLAIAVWNPLRH